MKYHYIKDTDINLVYTKVLVRIICNSVYVDEVNNFRFEDSYHNKHIEFSKRTIVVSAQEFLDRWNDKEIFKKDYYKDIYDACLKIVSKFNIKRKTKYPIQSVSYYLSEKGKEFIEFKRHQGSYLRLVVYKRASKYSKNKLINLINNLDNADTPYKNNRYCKKIDLWRQGGLGWSTNIYKVSIDDYSDLLIKDSNDDYISDDLYLYLPDYPFERKEKDKSGYVYLAKVRGLNKYKIGRTQQKDVNIRIKSISRSIPFDFELIHVIKTKDCFSLENRFHNYFDLLRIDETKEWYSFDEADIDYFKNYNT